jgi:hypothetical protein
LNSRCSQISVRHFFCLRFYFRPFPTELKLTRDLLAPSLPYRRKLKYATSLIMEGLQTTRPILGLPSNWLSLYAPSVVVQRFTFHLDPTHVSHRPPTKNFAKPDSCHRCCTRQRNSLRISNRWAYHPYFRRKLHRQCNRH